MPAPVGNKNAVGCGAKLIGNTNRLIHGNFSREYFQKRAERKRFIGECRGLLEDLEEFIKTRRE